MGNCEIQCRNLQNHFATSVITARTEAASRGQVVCANTNCNSSNRSAGWFVVDSGGNLLAEFKNSVAYILVLTAEDGGAVTQIALTPDGYNRDKLRYIFSVCRPGLSPVKLGGG